MLKGVYSITGFYADILLPFVCSSSGCICGGVFCFLKDINLVPTRCGGRTFCFNSLVKIRVQKVLDLSAYETFLF